MAEQKKLDLTQCINVPHLWRGILDSYHNYYDIFSELIQNSIDSVRKSSKLNHNISVSYDQENQIIEIIDNGMGLAEGDLQFFALGNTNKIDEAQSIGEKGLGASFILGISDSFYVESVTDNKKIIATCENAFNTIYDKKVPELNYAIEDNVCESYCKIRVKISQVDINIDSFSLFKYILRTKTAIGNTSNLFKNEDDREKINITVKFKGKGKPELSEEIPFLYLHLDELAKGFYPVFDAIYNTHNKKWIIDVSELEKSPRGILRLVDHVNKIYLTFAEVDIYKKFGENIGQERFPDDLVVSIKGCPTSVEVSKPRLRYGHCFSG